MRIRSENRGGAQAGGAQAGGAQAGGARRRGAITPLAALMGVFLFGMAAFAVDMGWIASSQAELQNAADAAALAGAGPLMDGFVAYYLPGQTSSQKATVLSTYLANARTKAKNFASYNAAGGVSSLVLNDSDIEFGYTDGSGNYSSSYTAFPNTIKVTLRRDSTTNGALTLFFGPAIGTGTRELTAVARATIYNGPLNSIYAGALPVTFDQAAWQTFLSTGQGTDGTKSYDSSGNPQIQIFSTFSDSGQFGWLSLDNDSVSASTLRDWIDNGPSSSDLQALKDAGLIPLSSHPANTWDWQGKTGFTASGVMAVNDHTGTVVTLPLYKAYSATDPVRGQGKNSYYDIVDFVSVRIMPVSNTNRDIIVQPAPSVVPATYLTSNVPAGTGSTTATYFAPPRLTY